MPDSPDDIKVNYPKRPAKRRGKNRTNQKDLGKKYAKELRKLGVHKPARAASARDVRIMKTLKDMLKNTWSQVIEEADNYKRLSEKQLEFFRRYAIFGRRNKIKAMVAAGYKLSRVSDLYKAAQRNLAHPHAEELLRAFELEEKAKMGLLVEDVAAWFENIATKAMEAGDFTNANRAMESYAKYLGMFTERKEITHRTVHSAAELDARIAELHKVLAEEKNEITKKLTIN